MVFYDYFYILVVYTYIIEVGELCRFNFAEAYMSVLSFTEYKPWSMLMVRKLGSCYSLGSLHSLFSLLERLFSTKFGFC